MASISNKRHRFSPEVIEHTLWLYHRFPLSLHRVEEMLLARGLQVSYNNIRRWSAKFGPQLGRTIRRRTPRRGDVWHLDEVQAKIGGKPHWLCRAVDSEGYVLDEVVSVNRDTKQARRLLVQCFKVQGWRKPKRIVTDKLRSHGAARRKLMPSVRHLSQKGLNNRAEYSHRPLRRREKIHQRFRSPGSLQPFSADFSAWHNLFYIPIRNCTALG
ncbi:MAG: IS6 family transposase [Pseudomonadota bacterium]